MSTVKQEMLLNGVYVGLFSLENEYRLVTNMSNEHTVITDLNVAMISFNSLVTSYSKLLVV